MRSVLGVVLRCVMLRAVRVCVRRFRRLSVVANMLGGRF